MDRLARLRESVDRIRNEIALHKDPEDPPGMQRFMGDVIALCDAADALTAAEALCRAVEDIQRQPWPPNWARVHDTARALRAALGE